MANTWQNAIEYEHSRIPVADNFLARRFSDKKIFRPAPHSTLQKADVDVVVSNKTGWPNEWMISEKFRRIDWGDTFIELYSSISPMTEGWGVQSVAHEHYFYIEDESIVMTECVDDIATLSKSNLNKLVCSIGKLTIVLFKIPTFGPNKTILWESICAAIPGELFSYIKSEIQTIKLN